MNKKRRIESIFVCFCIIFNALSVFSYADSEERNILFEENFWGNADEDFMKDPRNTSGNEYFSSGFIIENSDTPWRSDRFVVEESQICGETKNMIKKTFKSSTQQRPTRNLAINNRINMGEDAEYFLTYNFLIGEFDEFKPMENGQAANFDALMIDFLSRTGCGIAKNPEGKNVPFVSFFTSESNISYGTKEIQKGVMYNAVLKIDAFKDPDTPDVMSMAVYPSDEEFDGTYDVSHSYATSAVYEKVTYHFRASWCTNGDKSDMILGNVKCFKEFDGGDSSQEPETGNLSDEMLTGENTVLYEDFNYESGSLIENINSLNVPDDKKGFSTGWLKASNADLSKGTAITNSITDGNGNIELPDSNMSYYMRGISNGINFEDGIYYITWTMKGIPESYEPTYSQKLELGSSDGNKNKILLGLVKVGGTDTYRTIVRLNGDSTKYGEETLNLSDEYTMLARIEMDSGRENIQLVAYKRGTCPPDEWGVNLTDFDDGTAAERISYQTNFVGKKGFGNIIIDKYDFETESKYQNILDLISSAHLTLNEDECNKAQSESDSIPDGILKRELNKRIAFLREKIEDEKNNIESAEKIISVLEGTDFNVDNIDNVKLRLFEASEYISKIQNNETKTNLTKRMEKLNIRAEYTLSVVNIFVEKFEGCAPIYQNGWKTDENLSVNADEKLKSANGEFYINGMFSAYHDISKSVGDNLFFEIGIKENNTDSFIGAVIGELLVGIENGNLTIKDKEKTIAQKKVDTLFGSLFIHLSSDNIEAYFISDEKYTRADVKSDVSTDVVGICGDEGSDAVLNLISVQGASDSMIKSVSDIAAGLTTVSKYGNIKIMKDEIEVLPDSMIKTKYKKLCVLFEEENKKTVPKIKTVSVSGKLRPGTRAEAVYTFDDIGDNATDFIIQWNSANGEKFYNIPDSYKGKNLTLTVTPMNIFGISGDAKSVTVTVSDTWGVSSSGGGSGGYGVGSVIDRNDENTQSNVVIPEKRDTAYAFLDIENHWAKEEINFLAERGIVNGVGGEFFCPDNTVTRAEFAKMISEFLTCEIKSASFIDVNDDEWYAEAVLKVASCGIMNGTGEKFMPDENITREQMAAVLVRLFDFLGCKSEKRDDYILSDIDRISPWAVKYVLQCTSMKLMNGMGDGTFSPQQYTTRAQAASVIWRILKSV